MSGGGRVDERIMLYYVVENVLLKYLIFAMDVKLKVRAIINVGPLVKL